MDIEHLGPHTKIVRNKAQPPLSKKLHDFCTLMHMQPLDDEEGSYMLITRATEHPKVWKRRESLATIEVFCCWLGPLFCLSREAPRSHTPKAGKPLW